jgi:hypothetical protein
MRSGASSSSTSASRKASPSATSPASGARIPSTAPPEAFRRGDANGDGTVNITDPIATLGFLFLGQAPLACPDAADGDDSGGLNITDPIKVLSFLFTGGREPPAPGPRACGPDPTADPLGSCEGQCL